MKIALYCPRCGSDQLLAVGSPSKLDGKKDRVCQECKLALGPLRSHIVTGGLIFLACLVGLLGLWLVWAVSIPGGLFIFSFAAGSVFVGIIDMSKAKPLRNPPSGVSWQKPEASRMGKGQKSLRLWRIIGTDESTGSEVTREVHAESREDAIAECILKGIEVLQITEFLPPSDR